MKLKRTKAARTLKEGERICPHCDGCGHWVEKDQVCRRCNGIGKIAGGKIAAAAVTRAERSSE